MRAAYLGRGEGALIRTAYLGAGEASVRAVRWVRGIDVQPTVGGAGAIGCWLATRRSVVTARTRDLLGRERAAATRTRIRTAAPSAHQTHRGCCRYALRRGGTASFARAVR